MQTRLIVSLVLAGGLLSGCGALADPAKEEPVKFRPGLYSATVQGKVAGLSASDGTATMAKTCVKADDDADWVFALVRESLSGNSNCSTRNSERVGNSISASIACQLDLAVGPYQSNFVYTGVLTEDTARITGKIEMPDLTKLPGISEQDKKSLAMSQELMKSIDIGVEIKRDGDCQG